MPVRTDRKVAVVGLDSITPVMVDRYLAEGRMPNLARMRERGWWCEVKPTWPATTSTGWTTVATGAWPSTHGIEGFATHRRGEPLNHKVHCLSTEHVRAEQIWQTLERHELDSILLKYPMSWPPTGGARVTQVDGAGGWGGLKCVWDLVPSGCWDTHPRGSRTIGEESVGPQDWRTRDADNLDDESEQRIELGAADRDGAAGGLWSGDVTLAATTGGPARVELTLGGAEDGWLVLRAGDRRTARLRRGDWSDWLRVEFATPSGSNSAAPAHGFVRFKVLSLDAAAGSLRLYQSQVHRADGFTRPLELALELEHVAGPFPEWTESYDLLQGWIDHETQLEIYEQHVEWMSRVAVHLLRERPWHLFMTQIHVVDMAYHLYWGAVDPGHPDHDPAHASRFHDLLGRVHELADSFLGAILDEVDDGTLVLAMGDHGHDLYHSALMANHVLLRDGLLVLERDLRSGRASIDWARSAAYASSYRVYLNVSGRDPDGIVRPEDYRAAQQRVIDALYRVRDPRTREYPVRLALRQEDAESFGLYGDSMGDVVFAMAPGYQTRSSILLPPDCWQGNRLLADRVAALRPTRLFEEFTGDHDTSLPFSRSIRTLLHALGPDVRSGRRRVPADLADVAPTICAWLGIEAPADCDGKPLLDAFSRGGRRRSAAVALTSTRPPSDGAG